MTLETLMGGLKAAQLDTGHRISPGLARRLACRAGIIPAVLGSHSQVLDLGPQDAGSTPHPSGSRWRSSRAAAPPRAATGHRECATPTTTSLAPGGGTTVKNGRLLCPRHHARAHDPTYEMARLPGGKVRFHRRT